MHIHNIYDITIKALPIKKLFYRNKEILSSHDYLFLYFIVRYAGLLLFVKIN